MPLALALTRCSVRHCPARRCPLHRCPLRCRSLSLSHAALSAIALPAAALCTAALSDAARSHTLPLPSAPLPLTHCPLTRLFLRRCSPHQNCMCCLTLRLCAACSFSPTRCASFIIICCTQCSAWSHTRHARSSLIVARWRTCTSCCASGERIWRRAPQNRRQCLCASRP